MNNIIIKALSCGLFGLIGYSVWIISKVIVAAMLCKHPELSDDKVKYITNMISKDKNSKIN